MSDDNVTKLPVRFKAPPTDADLTLKIVPRFGEGCDHRDGYRRKITYLLREGETEIECGGCGTKLDPMFVLRELAVAEMRWHETRKLYQEEMKRLDGRKRTQCDHCGKMTRISRAKPRAAQPPSGHHP